MNKIRPKSSSPIQASWKTIHILSCSAVVLTPHSGQQMSQGNILFCGGSCVYPTKHSKYQFLLMNCLHFMLPLCPFTLTLYFDASWYICMRDSTMTVWSVNFPSLLMAIFFIVLPNLDVWLVHVSQQKSTKNTDRLAKKNKTDFKQFNLLSSLNAHLVVHIKLFFSIILIYMYKHSSDSCEA